MQGRLDSLSAGAAGAAGAIAHLLAVVAAVIADHQVLNRVVGAAAVARRHQLLGVAKNT